jgi:hypothetical protein
VPSDSRKLVGCNGGVGRRDSREDKRNRREAVNNGPAWINPSFQPANMLVLVGCSKLSPSTNYQTSDLHQLRDCVKTLEYPKRQCGDRSDSTYRNGARQFPRAGRGVFRLGEGRLRVLEYSSPVLDSGPMSIYAHAVCFGWFIGLPGRAWEAEYG